MDSTFVEDAALLAARVREARQKARREIDRATTAMHAARQAVGAATSGSSPRYFVVRGEVDGEPVRALWWRGTLLATGDLASRAELIVGMGERFDAPGHDTSVEASLDEPLAAMLTFVRACDRVHQVVFGPMGRAGHRSREVMSR